MLVNTYKLPKAKSQVTRGVPARRGAPARGLTSTGGLGSKPSGSPVLWTN